MTHTTPGSLICDFYKISHKPQYPDGTEFVLSTWTPRSNTHYPALSSVVAFGFQGMITKILVDYFNEGFFSRRLDEVLAEYVSYVHHCLGAENVSRDHLVDLHDLGYLPLEIKAVPEGTRVPCGVPMLTVRNTDPRFFWLTNYIETVSSAEMWMPSTAATIADQYKSILISYAKSTGGDVAFVPFQAHDFCMRGMVGLEASALAGSGHLLSFVGTDTIPAISYLQRYYNADITKELVGCSVPATEHSVMCAGGVDDEFGTYKRLITEVYPSGIVSIVSDTWDLFECINSHIRTLKPEIMARDGKVVIRPDSGDPVDIICGDQSANEGSLERKGVISLLWDIFGGKTNDSGFKELDSHIGAIYGDSITPDRCEAICRRLKDKGFASTNVVFGVGSYTYQYNTRDTFGFAMKSTAVVINGEERAIFKDPKTDDGTKKSNTGGVAVQRTQDGSLVCVDGLPINHDEPDVMRTIFLNGELVVNDTLANIRRTLAG